MTRRLTDDEHALWERLRETVKPLRRARKTPQELGGAARF